MTHNIYYCTVHKRLFHGLRPVGPHFTVHEEPYWKALENGVLKDLGECPYFKIPIGMHEFRVEEINQQILEILE